MDKSGTLNSVAGAPRRARRETVDPRERAVVTFYPGGHVALLNGWRDLEGGADDPWRWTADMASLRVASDAGVSTRR